MALMEINTCVEHDGESTNSSAPLTIRLSCYP